MSETEVLDDTPTEPGALERIADEIEVVPYARPPIFPSADEFGFIMHMAEVLSKGNLVPSACRGKPADVAIVLLGARDLGIPLTQAFTKLHVIDGKLSISAELMVALALQGGHRVWCEELNGELATACAQRRGSDYVARFTFTIDDASNAGLIGKDNWKHYPKAMLWARAVSGVVRMHLPDVTAGITYTPEEQGDAEHFTAHPASALDQAIKEDFATRANALPPDKQQALKADFKTWGLNPISRLTVEEEPTLRALLEKAEAIDVEALEAAQTPDRGDIPPTGGEAVRDDPGTFSGSFLPGPTLGVIPVESTPDIGSIQHEPDVEGPSVFNGDTGHCSDCGGPIWYNASGATWLHAEDDDADACPNQAEPLPAVQGIDVDALYAATHLQGVDVLQHDASFLDPKVRQLQIEVDISKMSQTKVLQALGEAGLPIDGSPKTLKMRLVEHRLAVLADTE